MQVRLMLETAAALVMFSDAWPRFNRRVLFYLTAPACVTVPIGGYVLVNVDAFLMRKVVASVVVVFALALLSGLRYSGAPRPATSLALGSIVGVLLGATSVGAPPVIPRERKTRKDHRGAGKMARRIPTLSATASMADNFAGLRLLHNPNHFGAGLGSTAIEGLTAANAQVR